MPDFSLSDPKTLSDERFTSDFTHIAEGEVSKADIQATTQKEFERKMMSIHGAGFYKGNHPCLK